MNAILLKFLLLVTAVFIKIKGLVLVQYDFAFVRNSKLVRLIFD